MRKKELIQQSLWNISGLCKYRHGRDGATQTIIKKIISHNHDSPFPRKTYKTH